jgi:hypothetical protein
MSDHVQIWLSPRCGKCEGEERMWCQDNVWLEGCEPGMCSAKPTEYVRADLVATPAEVARLRARVHQLSDALHDMHTGWRYIRRMHGDLPGVGWDRCEQSARAALSQPEAKE